MEEQVDLEAEDRGLDPWAVVVVAVTRVVTAVALLAAVDRSAPVLTLSH
jgi:hypothetical protein